MKRLILLILFLTSSFFAVSMPCHTEKKKATTKKEKTFSDLTSNEKKEAIMYMLSTGECEWKGIKLYGKVQFVENFPDFKIQFVENFSDIKVKFVKSFPEDCGEWQIVENFPDFKVQVVSNFADLKVEVVENFPGMEKD